MFFIAFFFCLFLYPSAPISWLDGCFYTRAGTILYSIEYLKIGYANPYILFCSSVFSIWISRIFFLTLQQNVKRIVLWNHLSSIRHIGIRVLKATRKGLDDLIVIGRSILRHESSRRESTLQPTLFLKKKKNHLIPADFRMYHWIWSIKKNNPHLTTKVIPQLWKLSTSNIWIIWAD